MMKKLTSRKFWLAIAGVVGAAMAALNIESMTQEQVLLFLGALGTLIAFILGESKVDAASVDGSLGAQIKKLAEFKAWLKQANEDEDKK